MPESVDCRQLWVDINELRKKRDILQEQIDETIDEGAEEADSVAFRRSAEELDEATERILERNMESSFEYFLPIIEDAEIIDSPIELGKDDRYLMIEDDRAIIRIGNGIYFCRKNEAGEWNKELFHTAADYAAKYSRINDEYSMLSLDFSRHILCRDNGNSLERIESSKLPAIKWMTFMNDGSILALSDNLGSFQRSTLVVGKDEDGDDFHRWQTQNVLDLPGGKKRFEASDSNGCYIIHEGDGYYFYCFDEKGEKGRTLLEDPCKGTDDAIGDIHDVKRVTDDTIIVEAESIDGYDIYYCYRISDNKPRFLKKVDIPASRNGQRYCIFPLSRDGQFLIHNEETIYQFSPDPGQDGTFVEHSVVAPNKEQLFPRQFNKRNGDQFYYLDNRLFLYTEGEGWKIVQMPERPERNSEQLKRLLVKIADKAEKEP